MIFHTIRNILRLMKISLVLYRNGALFILHDLNIAMPLYGLLRLLPFQKGSGTKGERLANALEQLGPAFIKLGQTLATRSDIIGEDLSSDLAKLQDRLPVYENANIKAELENEFGCKLEKLFSNFNTRPVAAASIAEVYKATTNEGCVVAVKVLRQNIEEKFSRDVNLFFWIAHIIEKSLPKAKRLRPIDIIKTFARSMTIEMDLRLEAAAASELAENLRDDKNVYIPKVDWQRTSKRVLTLEWIDAIPIHDKKRLTEQGLDFKKLCKNFAVSFFNQAYRDGFFHADMHPGNVLVDNKGRIIFIDFGIMGRLDQTTRMNLAEILFGFLKQDYLHVAKVHFRAGYVSSSHSLYEFAQACRSVGEPIVGLPANQISVAKLLGHLFQVTKDFDMETQPQLLLIQKTTVLVEGVGSMLDPSINMWKLAEPWIEEWAETNIGFDARVVEKLKDIAYYFQQDFASAMKEQKQVPDNVKIVNGFGFSYLIFTAIISAVLTLIISKILT